MNWKNVKKNCLGLFAAGLSLQLISCAQLNPDVISRIESDARMSWVDSSGHKNGRFVIGGTRVHFIDYGGSGQTLVFLSGLGNSAHVFDDFAPRFTDKFHAIALTRRGYGESGRPDDGFDTERLTDDVRDMLDSLKLDRVVLVGHSVAGDELSDFAVRFPQRTAGVVYLDAAYDRSETAARMIVLAVVNQLPPSPPAPGDDDCESVASYQEYLHQIYGVRFPESEVRATRLFDAQGRFEYDATDGGTNMQVMRGEKEPEYEKIFAPALALYAVNRGIERDYGWTKNLFIGRGAAENKARRAMMTQENFESTQREKFRNGLPNARVVEVSGASHYVFLSHPDVVEREMRTFLAGVLAVH